MEWKYLCKHSMLNTWISLELCSSTSFKFQVLKKKSWKLILNRSVTLQNRNIGGRSTMFTVGWNGKPNRRGIEWDKRQVEVGWVFRPDDIAPSSFLVTHGPSSVRSRVRGTRIHTAGTAVQHTRTRVEERRSLEALFRWPTLRLSLGYRPVQVRVR